MRRVFVCISNASGQVQVLNALAAVFNIVSTCYGKSWVNTTGELNMTYSSHMR